MRQTVQNFSTSLLDQVRTSNELEIILNYNPDSNAEIWEPGDRQSLDRLKLAIKCKLKAVLSHSNYVWEENRLKMNNSRLAVCSPRHCTTIVRRHVVWGSAQIQEVEHVTTDSRGRTNCVHVFRTQSYIHVQSAVIQGIISEKSIRKIRLPLSFVCFILR